MTNQTEREAFEKWMSDDGKWPRAVERNADGGYKLMTAAAAWTTWQAAWQARASLRLNFQICP